MCSPKPGQQPRLWLLFVFRCHNADCMRFRHRPHLLSRYVVSEDLEGFTPISPLRRCVVPMGYLAHVKRVLVDDEEVWSNEASQHNGVARLEKDF